MFLFRFMQKYGPSSSRAYCIFADKANSNVLGMLAIRDLNNGVIQKLLLEDSAKTQCTRDDKRDDISSIDYAPSLYLHWAK